ncbi:hypothetical protein L7F22_055253 [Adiantum nelumboides]|nr:hypothetical protein [Adiantum nelumboides]
MVVSFITLFLVYGISLHFRSIYSVLSELHLLICGHSQFVKKQSDHCLKVVELDFLYPSEGIHRRWDSGYRITATAATWDQAAFILSVPKKKPIDETQETLRTSAFPSTHVKEKWSKNLYIASVSYGRTVS